MLFESFLRLTIWSAKVPSYPGIPYAQWKLNKTLQALREMSSATRRHATASGEPIPVVEHAGGPPGQEPADHGLVDWKEQGARRPLEGSEHSRPGQELPGTVDGS